MPICQSHAMARFSSLARARSFIGAGGLHTVAARLRDTSSTPPCPIFAEMTYLRKEFERVQVELAELKKKQVMMQIITSINTNNAARAEERIGRLQNELRIAQFKIENLEERRK